MSRGDFVKSKSGLPDDVHVHLAAFYLNPRMYQVPFRVMVILYSASCKRAPESPAWHPESTNIPRSWEILPHIAAAFTKAYQAQFTAYAQGAYLFNTPLGEDQDPLNWWQVYEKTPNGGILAVCRHRETDCTLTLTVFHL